MEMKSKTLAVLVVVSQITLPVWSTAQETLCNIRAARPTTLQAYKDIKCNIKEEIKNTEKQIKRGNDKEAASLKKELKKLEKAKSDIKKQMNDLYKSASNDLDSKKDAVKKQVPTQEEAKTKAREVHEDIKNRASNALEKTKEALPSQEQVKDKAHEVHENIQENAHKAKKYAKGKLHDIKDGIKEGSNTFTGLLSKIGHKLGIKSNPTDYEIKEHQSKDGKKYYLIITMPQFNKEDTHVSLQEISKGDYVIRVHAENSTLSKKEASDEFSWPTFINEDNQKLYYHDGKLEASVSLPKNIKPDTCNAEFENYILKLEFDQEPA